MIKFEYADTGLTIADRTREFIEEKTSRLEDYIKGEATFTILAKKEGNTIELKTKLSGDFGILMANAENKADIELTELFAKDVFPKLKTQVLKAIEKKKKHIAVVKEKTVRGKSTQLKSLEEDKLDVNSQEAKNLTKQLGKEMKVARAVVCKTKTPSKVKKATKRVVDKEKTIAKKNITTQRRAAAKK